MGEAEHDQWSRWVLHQQFGGDPEVEKRGLSGLHPVRDKVLDNANVGEGDVLFDVGCGSGLIAFAALERVGDGGRVVFSDVSPKLLEYCEVRARELGLVERCTFVRAAADDLGEIADGSVDVVTTRSVLIYVKDKQRAFNEFYRVLKPGGRLSIFEPINRFMQQDRDADGQEASDETPVADLQRRLDEFYGQLQPPGDPMLDFDERDLIRQCEVAGFSEVHLELRADIEPAMPPEAIGQPELWESMLNTPGNPLVPSLREAIGRLFTADEATRYLAYRRALFERGEGKRRSALAYVWAMKGGSMS